MNILITRFIKERKLLRTVQDKLNISVMECPFIDFEYISPQEYPDTEWIFFASKNSILSFPDHVWHTDGRKYKVGVTGRGTGDTLREKLIEPDFEGNLEQDTDEIGKEFFETKKPKSVWFPMSDRSNRTIQKCAPETINIVETITYNTIVKSTVLQQEYDWYVFTSPSNVEGFFKENTIPEKAKILAIGKQTRDAIKKYTNKEIKTPEESSERGILKFFL